MKRDHTFSQSNKVTKEHALLAGHLTKFKKRGGGVSSIGDLHRNPLSTMFSIKLSFMISKKIRYLQFFTNKCKKCSF